jgi:hypothetical protein
MKISLCIQILVWILGGRSKAESNIGSSSTVGHMGDVFQQGREKEQE